MFSLSLAIFLCSPYAVWGTGVPSGPASQVPLGPALPVPGCSHLRRVLCKYPSLLSAHPYHGASSSVSPWAVIARNPHARSAWRSLQPSPLSTAMPSTAEAQCHWDQYRLGAVAHRLAGSPRSCPPDSPQGAGRRIYGQVSSGAKTLMVFQSPPELTHRTELSQRWQGDRNQGPDELLRQLSIYFMHHLFLLPVGNEENS